MKLAINIDHIATLRNARGGRLPDPVDAALACERAGAVGIVCHLREDRRHIRDTDVERLRATIKTKLDLEMAATEEIIGIACRVKPDLVTLVPEHRMELTTEGGLDVVAERARLTTAVKKFHDHGIAVSLFIDPVPAQIHAARETGAEMMEIHTGEYADATSAGERAHQLQLIEDAARLGKTLGLGVNAGHGLDYHNIAAVARIPEIDEVSIGYAVIVRAVSVGLESAVRQMHGLIQSA
ncbi:MAG: pyridoxine 5'-phosphate synthase [Bacteroidetes bacterium]|jgi:pyridoxine 5-phosphate synthase|nr:pyridoxine 5'-phosphate synthase [Bacteroidota bacterium]